MGEKDEVTPRWSQPHSLACLIGIGRTFPIGCHGGRREQGKGRDHESGETHARVGNVHVTTGC